MIGTNINERDEMEEIDWTKLRNPFPKNLIGKLPKPTRQQTDLVKQNFKNGIRCQLCGAWHHKDVVHLDYVGHAAITDRLLDFDPAWYWEPMATTEQGLPLFDETGGLWIKLNVHGVTRLGYGNAPNKNNQDPGNREKEVIGDALRNAAMRFGVGLELWHKGDLHAEDPQEDPEKKNGNGGNENVAPWDLKIARRLRAELNKALDTVENFDGYEPIVKKFNDEYPDIFLKTTGRKSETFADVLRRHKRGLLNRILVNVKNPDQFDEIVADFKSKNPKLLNVPTGVLPKETFQSFIDECYKQKSQSKKTPQEEFDSWVALANDGESFSHLEEIYGAHKELQTPKNAKIVNELGAELGIDGYNPNIGDQK